MVKTSQGYGHSVPLWAKDGLAIPAYAACCKKTKAVRDKTPMGNRRHVQTHNQSLDCVCYMSAPNSKIQHHMQSCHIMTAITVMFDCVSRNQMRTCMSASSPKAAPDSK